MGKGGSEWSRHPLVTNYFAWYAPSFPLPNPRPGRWVFCAWGGSALTSSVPGLGLRPGLKRTTAEQAEEALLQEAKDLAEVTAQGKG